MDARTSDLPREEPFALAQDTDAAQPAWRGERGEPSLSDVFASVRMPRRNTFWRKLLAFFGPGYLVAVGYMDPGNWATSLAGGSKFGYALLTIALLSNIMAIILQSLCTRLGVADPTANPYALDLAAYFPPTLQCFADPDDSSRPRYR